MSSASISIKPNNHKVHPCPTDKKLELINKLVAENSNMKIIVISSKELDLPQGITVMNDKDFITNQELTCEFLISYDLPQKAVIYPARVAKATQKAVILVDESEQKELYPIEMLLGRAIKQESINGFEYEKKEKVKTKTPYKKLSTDEIKDVAKKRYDSKINTPKRDENKEFKKPNKFEKKPKKPNKFLGKDENGKAIFSGKSGERNHRYDGTPKDKADTKPKKTGRKINIKSLKKSKD